MVAGLIAGDDDWLWVAVEWSPPAFGEWLYESDGIDATMTVVLLVAALVKATILWLILLAPLRGPLDRRERALRLLLYLAVVDALVLWFPIALLPDEVDAVLQLALWTAINVLFLLVIRWRSRVLRVAAGAMFAVQLAGLLDYLLDELDLLELGPGAVLGMVWMLGGVAGTVLTIIGQRRDGRWSLGTQVAGWLSLSVYLLVILFNLPFGWSFVGSLELTVLMDTAGLVSTLWLASTARELTAGGGEPADIPPTPRWIRVGAAAVAVLPVIALIHPEQSPRLTYSGWEMSCYDRRSFGDVKPAERDAVFLCAARSTDGGVPPMFPDSLSDQQVLGYGRALCRAKDADEQKAILTRAGSERPAWGADPRELVHVCPEIVGAAQPDLLRSEEETEAANDAFVAEANAKCRDPWPRTKGVVQATANYFLFADGDHGYVVHDPDDEAGGDEGERAIARLYDDDVLIGVAGSTVLVGHVEDVIDLCLTVKAFRTAPPRRLSGWYQVTEVPIISRTGRLTVPEMGDGEVGAGAPMPNLAIEGKGRYRVRVYVRLDRASEEHLVVVFPGASRKTLKLKP
ncbi:hypothetical protein [Herbidospora mongoliensis]|uniref:hypothetical protein n=1 Tax=Herbidospora mongoliensis TaxID=688067 RepID=UPI0012F8A4D0|nr:hypothetical protein [Herbidospora mongoliensis]